MFIWHNQKPGSSTTGMILYRASSLLVATIFELAITANSSAPIFAESSPVNRGQYRWSHS
jgi:hypothetical protein